MKTDFQVGFRILIFLTTMFGVMVSASHSRQSPLNVSFQTEDNRLLRPIVIPNLTDFSEDFFTSKSQFHSKNDDKLSEVFREKVFKVTDKDKESSEESVVRVSLTKEPSKFKENVTKFSSRYSAKPEVHEAVLQDIKEVHTRGIKEEKKQNENITEGSEVASLLEITERESDILPDNTVYPRNPENSPFLRREKDKQDQTSDTDDISDIKEKERELKTVETLPSVDSWANRYSDEEEQENREAVQHGDIDMKECEEEEKKGADDYVDDKNYHSIQTPLQKIKFMGPQDFNDDSESSRKRTRPINSIERNHARLEWPYSKTQVKAEAEKDNEISTDGNESHDKEDSKEWQNDKTSSNISDLDRAVEKDEARYGPASNSNHKYNLIRERNRHLENQKALIAEEEKDHQRPLFKILSHKSDNPSQLNFGGKTIEKTNKQEKEIRTSRLTSTESSPKLFKNDAIFNKLESTNLNISKELEPNFQSLKFLSSTIFNKNSELSGELSKNIFIQELENKETIDQNNLYERKSTELGGGTDVTSQSFSHLQDSDEMYNQILANIQSVFGLRTQPLKSNVIQKDNKDSELEEEENNSLTWSTTFVRRTKTDHDGPEKLPAKRNERNLKNGSI